jgi:hypothetical protein
MLNKVFYLFINQQSEAISSFDVRRLKKTLLFKQTLSLTLAKPIVSDQAQRMWFLKLNEFDFSDVEIPA